MWAREPGSGEVLVDALCNSCHDGDVDHYRHPSMFEAWSHELRAGVVTDGGATMPVFDDSGSRALTGVIGCPTCHDAHQQRAEGLAKDKPGPFLRRLRPENLMCADCHGQSALRRYQFFHSTVSRSR